MPTSDFATHILFNDFQPQWLNTSDPSVGQVKDGQFKLPLKTLIFDFVFWNTLRKFINTESIFLSVYLTKVGPSDLPVYTSQFKAHADRMSPA